MARRDALRLYSVGLILLVAMVFLPWAVMSREWNFTDPTLGDRSVLETWSEWGQFQLLTFEEDCSRPCWNGENLSQGDRVGDYRSWTYSEQGDNPLRFQFALTMLEILLTGIILWGLSRAPGDNRWSRTLPYLEILWFIPLVLMIVMFIQSIPDAMGAPFVEHTGFVDQNGALQREESMRWYPVAVFLPMALVVLTVYYWFRRWGELQVLRLGVFEVQCPNCGASFVLDPSAEEGRCGECLTEFELEVEIDQDAGGGEESATPRS